MALDNNTCLPCKVLATVECLEVIITAKLQSSQLIIFSHILWISEHTGKTEKQQSLVSKNNSHGGNSMMGYSNGVLISSLP